MTQAAYDFYLSRLTPDERYVYEERLGIYEVTGVPTDEEHALAHDCVRRFRKEHAAQLEH